MVDDLRKAQVKDGVDMRRERVEASEPKRAVITFLRLAGIVLIVACAIYGINAPAFGLTIALSGVFSGGLLIGVAEILDVLQGIQFNTRR